MKQKLPRPNKPHIYWYKPLSLFRVRFNNGMNPTWVNKAGDFARIRNGGAPDES